jgi:hypothetical protein
MQVEVTWREEVTRRRSIGVNVENVIAAGFDPNYPPDMLEYLQMHMDRTVFVEQTGGYDDVIAISEPTFLEVDGLDRESREHGVA